MKIYAIVRDWSPQLALPTSRGAIQLEKDQIIRCVQPDNLDNAEFNLILIFGRRRIHARSIDFDFLYEGIIDTRHTFKGREHHIGIVK